MIAQREGARKSLKKHGATAPRVYLLGIDVERALILFALHNYAALVSWVWTLCV